MLKSSPGTPKVAASSLKLYYRQRQKSEHDKNAYRIRVLPSYERLLFPKNRVDNLTPGSKYVRTARKVAYNLSYDPVVIRQRGSL